VTLTVADVVEVVEAERDGECVPVCEAERHSVGEGDAE
jgi:hypothetical protein